MGDAKLTRSAGQEDARDGALVIDLDVVPRSSRTAVGGAVGERLRVKVTSPPVDGVANLAVIAALANAFGVRKAAIAILQGERGRRKTVRIRGASPATLAELLASGRPGARTGSQ